jgi:hypothetical protein
MTSFVRPRRWPHTPSVRRCAWRTANVQVVFTACLTLTAVSCTDLRSTLIVMGDGLALLALSCACAATAVRCPRDCSCTWRPLQHPMHHPQRSTDALPLQAISVWPCMCGGACASCMREGVDQACGQLNAALIKSSNFELANHARSHGPAHRHLTPPNTATLCRHL